MSVHIGPNTERVLNDLQATISDVQLTFSVTEELLTTTIEGDSTMFSALLAKLLVDTAEMPPADRVGLIFHGLGFFVIAAMVLDLRNEVGALDDL